MPHECTNCDRTFPDGSKEMLSGCPDCGGNKFRYRPAGGKLDDAGTDADEGSADPDRSGAAPDPVATDPDPSVGPKAPDRSGVADTVTRATRNIREWVGVDDDPSRDPGPDDAEVVDEGPGGESDGLDPFGTPPEDAVVDGDDAEDAEDAAQASARTSMVEPDELPDGSTAAGAPASGPEATGIQSGSDGSPADADAGSVGPDPDVDEDPDLSDLRAELNDQFESIKIVEPGQYELNLMELYDRDEYIISLKEDGRYVIEVPESWRSSLE